VNAILGAQLGFETPQWANWLLVLAAALLAVEYAILLGRIWRRSPPGPAAGQTLVVLTGPIGAVASLVFAVMTAVAGQDLQGLRLARLSFRAALLHVLAALLAFGTGAHWPHAALIVLAAEGVLWAVRSYQRTTSPVGGFARRTMLALRILAILLLAAYASRPSLAYERTRQVRRVLLVGIDTSASMARADMPADWTLNQVRPDTARITRHAAIRDALSDRMSDLEDLAQTADIRLFRLARAASPTMALDEPQAITRLLSAPPEGQATAIGDSLTGAISEMDRARRELAAIVLISDGNQNTVERYSLERLVEDLALRRIPLHTVGAGWETVTAATTSLQARQITSPDEVNAFRRLQINAEIRAIGLAGRKVEITCTFADEQIETVTREIADDDETIEPRFVHVPLQAGYHRAAVEVKLLGEPPRNLQLTPTVSKLVHVVDRELRILYVEGKIRYENKYIARALAAAERFTLDRRVLLLPPDDRQGNGLSDNADDWLMYHAILLGDVPADRFTPAQIEIMAELVDKKGKGLGMIGGRQAFAAGGWARTPLADILPVDLTESRGQLGHTVNIVPTRQGLASTLMRIAPGQADVAETWARLEQLKGANKLAPKPAATVLARSTQGDALIVQGRFGTGRTLAIAFDTTYQWVLTPKDTADLQKRFWRQVALYLANPKGNIWITTDKAVYDLQQLATGAQSIQVAAGIENAAGRPILRGADETVKLIDPEGNERTIELMARERMRTGRLSPPTETGAYKLVIEGRVDGETLRAEHRFQVIRRDLEGRDVLADHDRLRDLAEATGGRFVKLAELGALLDELPDEARPRLITERDPEPLWKAWAWHVAAAAIALLCLEWSWRKRKGLV
jgi:hypothetical protein